MKKKLIIGLSAFGATLLFCGLLAWLSGFNFDHRSVDVAFGTFVAFSVAGFIGGGAYLSACDL